MLNNFKLINKSIKITGTTSHVFNINAEGTLHTFSKIRARYIKDFPVNIIAEADIRKHYDIRFVYGECLQEDKAHIFTRAPRTRIATFSRNINNLYTLDETEEEEAFITIDQDLHLQGFNTEQIRRMKIAHEMHRRMGYLSTQNMESIIRHNGISGKFNLGEIDEKDISNYRKHLHSKLCTGCNLAKMYSEPAKVIDFKSIPHQPGVLHADVMHITYDEGILDYLVAIDQQCAMTFAVQLKKSEKVDIAKAVSLIKQSYKRYGHELTAIHFDNEPSINNINTKGEVHEAGVNTVFHTPGRHVRRAENVIKLIKSTYKAILVGLDYACPFRLYPYAVRWAVQAINLASKSGNALMAPWTIFSKQKLDFEHHFMAKFGDIVITRANSNDDMRPKSNKPVTTFAVILCHDENVRGTYVLMDLNTRHIIKRRQFRLYQDNNTIIQQGIKAIGKSSANTTFGHVSENGNSDATENELSSNKEDYYRYSNNEIEMSDENYKEDEIANNSNDNLDIFDNTNSENDDNNNIVEDIDDGEGELLNDSDCESISEDDEIDPIDDCEDDSQDSANEDTQNDTGTRKSSRSWQPSEKYLESFALAAINSDHMNLKEATKAHGKEVTDAAVIKEIGNMYDKGVWEETNYKPGAIIVPSQIILKAKYKANGSYDKLKARLIALGNRQKLPENFLWTDVESPTAAIANIMTILQLVPKLKLDLAIVDIAAAYLHAEIQGDIYMRLGEDISNIIRTQKKLNGNGPMLVKLKKCIYGLKQSGRRWFELLKATFLEYGLKQSSIDRCIFYNSNTMIAIYVDDIIIASKETSKIIEHLERKFGEITKQVGPEYSFLGMKIIATKNVIKISQDAYIDKITKEIKPTGASRIPHRTNFKPRADNDYKEENKSSAMKAMYVATRTRPEILYNTSILATNTYNSTNDINKLFQYLKETISDGIKFYDDPIELHCYCDASFMQHVDRKSHTGFAIFLDKRSGAIMAKSKKQQSIAHSSTEAELIALFDAGRNLLLLRELLEELGIKTNIPIVYEDNTAVISIVANNAIPRGNSKFIERKYLQSREWIQNERLKIIFTTSEEQIADGLTKAKYSADFMKFKNKILG